MVYSRSLVTSVSAISPLLSWHYSIYPLIVFCLVISSPWIAKKNIRAQWLISMCYLANFKHIRKTVFFLQHDVTFLRVAFFVWKNEIVIFLILNRIRYILIICVGPYMIFKLLKPKSRLYKSVSLTICLCLLQRNDFNNE